MLFVCAFSQVYRKASTSVMYALKTVGVPDAKIAPKGLVLLDSSLLELLLRPAHIAVFQWLCRSFGLTELQPALVFKQSLDEWRAEHKTQLDNAERKQGGPALSSDSIDRLRSLTQWQIQLGIPREIVQTPTVNERGKP